MIPAVVLEPIGTSAGEGGRIVVAGQPRLVDNLGAMAARRLERPLGRRRHTVRLQGVHSCQAMRSRAASSRRGIYENRAPSSRAAAATDRSDRRSD